MFNAQALSSQVCHAGCLPVTMSQLISTTKDMFVQALPLLRHQLSAKSPIAIVATSVIDAKNTNVLSQVTLQQCWMPSNNVTANINVTLSNKQ